MIARSEVEPSRRTGTDRSAAFVIHRGHAGQHGGESCAPRLQAEVEILEPKEIILVEQPAGVEHLAPDEHQAPADAVDDTGGRAILRGDATAVPAMSHAPAARRARPAE